MSIGQIAVEAPSTTYTMTFCKKLPKIYNRKPFWTSFECDWLAVVLKYLNVRN